jgi:hypothetical protein
MHGGRPSVFECGDDTLFLTIPLERGHRIIWRACSTLHRERRHTEQESPSVARRRSFAYRLEVAIVKDRYSHGDDGKRMDWLLYAFNTLGHHV